MDEVSTVRNGGMSMNDRYLFRAKRKNWRELPKEMWWVEGYLYGIWERRYILWGMTNDIPNMVEVDPSTICQCTGLKDKNGKMIWENDICRRVLLPTKRIKTNFKIAYVPYKCCILAIDLDGSNITFLSDYINNQYEVEVIGNIFDNKELLESEDKDENNY